jgi:hypothetical protein
MARTHRTACKSTSHQLIGQLAPQNVPQPHEPQHDTPQHISQEEEPYEIKLVVHESLAAQGTPAEEQQQEDHDVNNEDKDDEEYIPLSDTEVEKMYKDAAEVESFGAEAPVPTGRLQGLLVHLGITTAPRYRIKEVPHPGWVEFKVIAEIFSGSRVLCSYQGPTFRASHNDAVAEAAWQVITSWVRSNKNKL